MYCLLVAAAFPTWLWRKAWGGGGAAGGAGLGAESCCPSQWAPRHGEARLPGARAPCRAEAERPSCSKSVDLVTGGAGRRYPRATVAGKVRYSKVDFVRLLAIGSTHPSPNWWRILVLCPHKLPPRVGGLWVSRGPGAPPCLSRLLLPGPGSRTPLTPNLRRGLARLWLLRFPPTIQTSPGKSLPREAENRCRCQCSALDSSTCLTYADPSRPVAWGLGLRSVPRSPISSYLGAQEET